MRYLLFFAFSYVLIGTACAQDAITGDPQKMASLYARVHVDVKGSPYLYDEWSNGSVYLTNGSKHENLELMYDVLEGKVLYKSTDGKTWEFTAPVASFNIDGKAEFKKGANGFYQILFDGDKPLYKKLTKNVLEKRPYGSSNIEKTVTNSTNYYIGDLKAPKRIKTDNASVAALFGADETKAKQYIKDHKLNVKKEEDLIKVFEYMDQDN